MTKKLNQLKNFENSQYEKNLPIQRFRSFLLWSLQL